MTVVAEYGEDKNVTHALFIYLIKLFNSETKFDFSKMLTKYKSTCIPSAWEILINGHWIHVNMGFTSGVLNGRIKLKTAAIGRPERPERNPKRLYRTYKITKMDYCKQVSHCFILT